VRARAKDDPNLNETLARVFHNIENSARGTDSEDNLKGLFDDLKCAMLLLVDTNIVIYYTNNGDVTWM